ncbi:hypothetical protein REPUB_Repub02eG0186400 [Reevesia pubescens]
MRNKLLPSRAMCSLMRRMKNTWKPMAEAPNNYGVLLMLDSLRCVSPRKGRKCLFLLLLNQLEISLDILQNYLVVMWLAVLGAKKRWHCLKKNLDLMMARL